jgi:hypothetical protein
MLRRHVILAAALVLITTHSIAFANGPLPSSRNPSREHDDADSLVDGPKDAANQSAKPAALRPVKLVYNFDPKLKVSRIVIPKRFLPTATLQSDAPQSSSSGPGPVQSIVAAVALSLALVVGLLSLRKGKWGVAVAVVAGTLILGAFGLWATRGYANGAAPPRWPESWQQPVKPEDRKIVIEVVEDGDEVVLTLGNMLYASPGRTDFQSWVDGLGKGSEATPQPSQP